MTTASLQEDRARFAADYAPRALTVRGHAWRFFDTGGDGPPVLLLPGALGRGETSFAYVLGFAGAGFRAISTDYPASARTLADLTDGAAGLLTALGVARAHVVGGSFGGLVAQSLLASHPERVLRLALTDTTAPVPRRALLMRLFAGLLSALPLPLIRATLDRGVRAYLADLPPGERAFWRAHFGEALGTFTRAEFVSRARVWAEFDAAPWGPPCAREGVLLVTASGDRILAAGAQQGGLRWRYPCAAVRLVEGDHAASLARPDAYITLMTEFFRGPDR